MDVDDLFIEAVIVPNVEPTFDGAYDGCDPCLKISLRYGSPSYEIATTYIDLIELKKEMDKIDV
ncbi:MAG: hypothetical protein HRT61_01115 [Ekhidna sp.]|nr:hypothetical protein [Ekhidna sp.]